MRFFITIYLWLLVFVTFLLFLPVITFLWCSTILFDRRLVVIHMFASFWATLYIWLNPLWRLNIEGKEKICKKQPYVIVSNHQSLLDIAILYSLFLPFKWVTKVENYKIPGIGWIMILNRYIKVDRKRKETYLRMIEDSKNAIIKGSSILIFPEGTRSKSGNIGSFKTGPFRIAQEAGVPLLPVVIDGSGRAFPDKGWILNGRQNFKVHILDPIPFETFQNKDLKVFSLEVREVMINQYQQLIIDKK